MVYGLTTGSAGYRGTLTYREGNERKKVIRMKKDRMWANHNGGRRNRTDMKSSCDPDSNRKIIPPVISSARVLKKYASKDGTFLFSNISKASQDTYATCLNQKMLKVMNKTELQISKQMYTVIIFGIIVEYSCACKHTNCHLPLYTSSDVNIEPL